MITEFTLCLSLLLACMDACFQACSLQAWSMLSYRPAFCKIVNFGSFLTASESITDVNQDGLFLGRGATQMQYIGW